MFAYYIVNIYTKEYNCIFGYSYPNALHRASLDRQDWDCYDCEYLG